MTVLVCSQCDHQMGNYHHTDWGIICDDCFIEYEAICINDAENEAKRDWIDNGGAPELIGY